MTALRLLSLLFLILALPARAFETVATHAWVYDMTTHTVLLDKDGDIPVPPASMSKPNLVAILTLSRIGARASPTRITPASTRRSTTATRKSSAAARTSASCSR